MMALVMKTFCQHFTVRRTWITPSVRSWLDASLCASAGRVLDPFAGRGHVLDVCRDMGARDIEGWDIDPRLGWRVNDSLAAVPATGRLIATNPPWMAMNSATAKGLPFPDTNFQDIYMLGLHRCLSEHKHVVAILPWSFTKSGQFRARLELIDCLDDPPFTDTKHPSCVACFGPEPATRCEVRRNGTLIGMLDDLERMDLTPKHNVCMKFGLTGQIGLRCADGKRPADRAKFCRPSELGQLRPSSRSKVLVSIDRRIDIGELNRRLEQWRAETNDMLMLPFRDRADDGRTRMRLSFAQARALIEAVQN